ncbi:unnamed protein product [Tenebrio molitor]|nr:unnamed protein product [Tenebrio molitor]
MPLHMPSRDVLLFIYLLYDIAVLSPRLFYFSIHLYLLSSKSLFFSLSAFHMRIGLHTYWSYRGSYYLPSCRSWFSHL